MKKFINTYLNDTKNLLDLAISNHNSDILKIKKEFEKCSKSNKKIIFIGNGGSAATCSHASVDLTKNAKIRAINFNEADLITCFANDFSYSEWMQKSLEFYADKGDLVVLISTSGKSQNILNCGKYLKKKSMKFITFSGMKRSNSLKKMNTSGINVWVDSKSYNQIEIIHHFILLLIVDMIIGRSVYKT